MIDSLTVSILLVVALAIGAVVFWDAWKAWRLRRLAVRESAPPPVTRPVAEPPENRSAETRAPSAAARPEPSLGLGDSPPEADRRAEPQLGGIPSIEPKAVQDPEATYVASEPRNESMPFLYVDSRPVPADAQPIASRAEQAPAPASMAPVSRPAPALQPKPASGPVTPAPAPVEASAPTPPAVATANVAANALSERTDCLALLRFVQPVAAERLVSLGQTLRRSGSKPVSLEVLGPQPVAEGWHLPRAGEVCTSARFGLLLANRSGPVNALEYTDFAQRIREVAASLGVGVEIDDMTGVLARARLLDADSAKLDAQVCINVDASETLGPSQLAALAGPLAVVERGNNRYARLGPRGETLFSVSLGEQPNRLSFLLDVPRVDPGSKPFSAMVECVKICARRLPGRIIDDGGKALNDRSIETIAHEIEQRCASLAAAGLPAGSTAALRVFN